MHNLCDAIHWMRMSNRKTFFTLTDEETAHCEISKQRKVYYKYDADEELNVLPTYQIMNHFKEFTDILSGNLYWQDAQYFTEYYKE